MEQEYALLQLTSTAPTAACPCCAVSSSSIHSRYQRHLTDLPWGTCTVRIQLRARKFVCQNPRCERRIFTESLPALVAAYARKTRRLITVLRAIGVALGGNAGVRLAARLRLPTSPATVLRLVRTAPVPHPSALQAVGVDEWAWRRGQGYGTTLVDLQTHCVVDLLPDCSAATVVAWLAEQPTISVVCRDRSDLSADGIRPGGARGRAGHRPLSSRPQPPPGLGSLPDRSPIGAPGGRFITRLRRAADAGQSPEPEGSPHTRPQGPSARAVSFAIVCPAAKRSSEVQTYLAQLCQVDASVARAYALSQAFLAMVRERRGDDLEAWMAEATHSGIDELARFARGLQEDLSAITAGLTLEWSNGVTEGHVHRLKLLKRQGYGRAGFALLRQRILQAA
jgi:transposase